ncbi:hypothetical protein [Spirosoma endophyticum]|uniref:Uncharacterized protein n=1 Tax=Spirosoma endophyticum TaxID=662367 RepID=A0A1I1UAF5_9BACT|nr:hypothetical protein [Spirosoma endophyticum]SFD67727.1 hypothetical protein SAMN05216167_106189 [Spirosoma endophyticum]
MKTLEELNSDEQNLKAQLDKIADDKIKAAQEEKDQKLSLLGVLQTEAEGFREQASKATSDAEKRSLYGYATINERKIKELQIELGIYSGESVVPETDFVYETKQAVLRKINQMIIKAAITLGGYFITNSLAGAIDAGFFSAVLQQISNLFFYGSALFGGVWLCGMILYWFVSDYIINELSDDFKGLTPFQKILILGGIFGILLHFLNSVVPDAL